MYEARKSQKRQNNQWYISINLQTPNNTWTVKSSEVESTGIYNIECNLTVKDIIVR